MGEQKGWFRVMKCDEYFAASLALDMCHCIENEKKQAAVVSLWSTDGGLFSSHSSPRNEVVFKNCRDKTSLCNHLSMQRNKSEHSAAAVIMWMKAGQELIDHSCHFCLGWIKSSQVPCGDDCQDDEEWGQLHSLLLATALSHPREGRSLETCKEVKWSGIALRWRAMLKINGME